MNSPHASPDPGFDEVCRFIIKLGESAHGYGSTAARLEMFLSKLTRAFGIEGVFRSSPTDIVFAFQKSGDQEQRIHLSDFPGTGLDLTKLAMVGDLVDSVVAGTVSISEATTRLDSISKTPPQWGVLASALGYALVGAGLAVLFSLTWWDVLFATLLSLVVYGMVWYSGRSGQIWAEWLPLSSAFVAGVLASAARMWVPELNVVMVIVTAIAVLLPGFTISVGLIELVGKHVTSGLANLMSGIVYLVKQIAGAWLGVGMMSMLLSVPAATAGTPIDAQWLWLFMPLLIIALCLCFQTSRRDFLAACVGCAVAYGGVLLGSAITGSNLGNLIGTIIAVMFANLWARKTGRPTSIVLLPAIILLVSGSIGFRGLASMATGQMALGEQQFLQMFIVALTIAAGILVGNTISRPKVTL